MSEKEMQLINAPFGKGGATMLDGEKKSDSVAWQKTAKSSSMLSPLMVVRNVVAAVRKVFGFSLSTTSKEMALKNAEKQAFKAGMPSTATSSGTGIRPVIKSFASTAMPAVISMAVFAPIGIQTEGGY